jgi:hypothetical protein
MQTSRAAVKISPVLVGDFGRLIVSIIPLLSFKFLIDEKKRSKRRPPVRVLEQSRARQPESGRESGVTSQVQPYGSGARLS